MTESGGAGGGLADIWPDGAELAALCDRLVAVWLARAAQLRAWDEAARAFPAAGAGWRPHAARIQIINAFQWREEDRSRDPAADDAALAAVKRSIDASNGRRVRAVEAFDVQVIDGLQGHGLPAPAAPLASESPGSIVDRLTVLALKRAHARDADRLALLTEQWRDLLGCLDRLGADVAAGRARVKLYRQVKLYGAPEVTPPAC
ncbi:MAG: DUF4254 domain-containing protein [Candidatus Krumholzibacteriia bacterium]